MAKNSTVKSWVDLCDEYMSSSSSADENTKDDSLEEKHNLQDSDDFKVTNCKNESKEEYEDSCKDKNTQIAVPKEVVTKVEATEEQITTEEKSPFQFSYASILKNSASKSNINFKPETPSKLIVEKPEMMGSTDANTKTKTVKREIQREFLQDDLSLTSHLDVFHMQSPLKLEPLDEDMNSPLKSGRETRAAKKRLGPKLSLCEDSVMADDLLMPSPKKATMVSSRRKREPGDSPLICKRSRNSSGLHNTPRCVVPVKQTPVELETDEQILLRRQKQIDYGKNTIGYERYCQMVPKEKRHRMHPQTPPKHIKYSRRAWDGLIKQWRQKLHFWDPPSKGGGNIDDLDISSMSEVSSDTGSSLGATPRHNYRLRCSSRVAHSSASESSSVADDSGFSPLK